MSSPTAPETIMRFQGEIGCKTGSKNFVNGMSGLEGKRGSGGLDKNLG